MASSITGLCKKKYTLLSLSNRRLRGRNTNQHTLLIRTTVTLLLLSLLIYNIFNVYVYLGEIDLAKFKDTTTTATNNGHCIFVMNKLYGNHTLSRVNKGLEWYKTITLQSIGLASQYINGNGYNNTFAAIILSAEGAYYEPALLNLKNTDGMPQLYINTTEKHNMYTVPYLLREHSCNVITMMRVDGDDMIYPDVFEYILQGWEDIHWEKQTNSTLKGAMVIGGRLLTKVTLASPSSSLGDLKCLIERKRNEYFNSAGLSVTLPVSVLEEKYGLNPFIVWSHHVKLAHKIRTDMKDMGLQTVIEDYPKLGVATSTQLSGHFNRHHDILSLQDCNESYLMSEFNEDIGSLIWSARDAIPKLTNEEWRENAFIMKELAKIKRLAAEKRNQGSILWI